MFVPLKLRILCTLASTVGSALGGTIITAGLPSRTAIINIDAVNDGAASYDSSQTYFYQPFSTTGTLLEYTFQPGAYTFQIIDASDAAAEFRLPASQLSQIYTAWTYNSPWATDYLAFDSSAATNSSEPQLFTGAVVPQANLPGFTDASAAYNAAKAGGYDDQIVVGNGGRYGGTVATEYTFTSPETLIFAVPDYYLSDNAGGVSVLISPVGSTASSSAPEPASFLLSIMGLAAVVIRGSRKAYRCLR